MTALNKFSFDSKGCKQAKEWLKSVREELNFEQTSKLATVLKQPGWNIVGYANKLYDKMS